MIRVRWMIAADLPSVLAIERHSFPDPWTERNFRDALRDQSCVGVVCERSDDGDHAVIDGFIIYALEKRSIDVWNFAVHPGMRRQGVGSLMVEHLYRKLNDRRTRLVVHVADYNLHAQLFWRAVGFRAVGIDRTRFAVCDAYKFVRRRCAVTYNT